MSMRLCAARAVGNKAEGMRSKNTLFGIEHAATESLGLGRWPGGPGGLPPRGSHRTGRARTSASGSSTGSSPSHRGGPVAIPSSSGDMRKNLDVFNMFPSMEPAGRRFASLHRVLRGEFPCFHGTIKALRLPDARPAALRCPRLAVPRLARCFAPAATRAGVAGLELVTRCSSRELPWRRQDLPSSWGTSIICLHMFFDPGRTTMPDQSRHRGAAPAV